MESIIKKIYEKNRIIRYIELIIGITIMAISFNLFISPNNIVFGGLTGLSVIATKFINIDAPLFIFICSVICIILSIIFLDKETTLHAIFGSVLLPILINITENISVILKIDTSDKLLLAIFGGVLYGFGLGLVFKAGYTAGGTDIINKIMSKYFKITMGTSMLMVDGLIVLSGAFIFGWTKFMYAIVVLYIVSIMSDRVLIGVSNAKAFYIITENPSKVAEYVINELNHSVTEIKAKGLYTESKTTVLFTVIPTKEYYKFKEGIKEIDKNAFITVIDAYEVLGGE